MKFRSLESLRGVAAIVVVFYHSAFVVGAKYPIIAQGAIFVDFFFILSGFVMAYAYTGKIQSGLGFVKFITLRVGRLYPLHIFLLIIWLPYVLLKAFAFHKMGVGSDPLITNNILTFSSNVLLINSMGVNGSLSWNYPAWSVSVEFFTYISFFLFVYFAKSKIRPAQLFLVSAISYLALYYLTNDSLLSTYEFGFIRCIGGFFLGSWVYHLIKSSSFSFSFGAATFCEFVAVGLALVFVSFSQSNKEVQLASLASFAIVIFVFSAQEKGALSVLLQNRLMLYLGTLSYSIYMTHAIVFAVVGNIFQQILKVPITVVERVGEEPLKYFDVWYADIVNVLCLVVIILLSSLTYKYIESPFREKFRTFSKRFDVSGSLNKCTEEVAA